MRTVRLLIVVGAATALMACGGGSGDSGLMDPPGTDPFPLAAGSEWTYDAATTGDGGRSQVVWRVSDIVVSGTETTFNWDGSPAAAARLRRTATEIVEIPAPGSDVRTAIGPLTVLRLPLTVGAKWTPVDGVVQGSGNGPEWTVKITFEVYARADVVTPQGSYRGAYIVIRSESYQAPHILPGSSQTVDWIVPGIGVVKRVSSSIPLGGVRPHEVVYELTAYRPGPR